ncbi:ABC transporter ATPase [Carbonactinospora thermoautotrophica]|uniref:ABC transporter ATPase n=1 Tax=Carbonactinospora thermoautotrophica TaxID=1469144 RepID=A0A132NK08_9ACTN|nr:ABC transporter ATP-binding protein [Carbonactinospora thermoautotrophica]KWX04704.1 ABC transporter ATPase [Carbonactinospora thermoautotrophica]KWX10303.1 ABC transporter ATPase [Carbonactinospora thermoautotrophica]
MMLHSRLIRLAGEVAGPLTRCVLLGLLVTGAYLAQALLLAAGLAALFGGDTQHLVPLVAGLCAVIAVRAVLLVWRDVAGVAAGAEIRARIRDRLVAKLAELGPAYLTTARAGATQTALVDGVESLDAYYSRYLPQAVITVVVPIPLTAWLATVHPVAALVLAACVALTLGVPRLWDALLARRGSEHWDTYESLAADYLEAMQGMPTLKAFGAVGRARARLEARSAALYRATVRKMRVSLIDTGIADLLIQGGGATAVTLATWSFSRGGIGTRDLFWILLVSSECFRPVRDLARHWHAGYLGMSAVDGISALLDAQPAVPDTGRVDKRWTRPPRVEFDAVTFTYPGRERPAVQDVCLTLEPGETVALVGHSGSGKSTLVSLLLRHHDPQSGQIRVDGQDIRDLTLDSLRRGIAVVAQDTYLFHGTIADNLRLARPDASDAELVAAARAANAHEFIAALPQGYGTVLGERGNTLSGGQRQRLAIARALLADAPLLVLDEATSSVDARREAEIAEALARLRAGRTCLVIAHRLATVRDADRIVVLSDGRVVEVGDHARLLDRGGVYARLVAAQEVTA